MNENAADAQESMEAPAAEATMIAESAHLEALAAARLVGIADERARVAALEAAADGRPHLSSLLASAKADGLTVEEFKLAAFDVQPSPGEQYLAAVEAESPAPVVAQPEASAPVRNIDKLPAEDKARALWESDASLRDEFSSVETLTHFIQNGGNL